MRVLEDLFRLHSGQRILVFTKTNVMAREVSVRFLIPSLLHHCRKKERKDILMDSAPVATRPLSQIKSWTKVLICQKRRSPLFWEE